MTQQEREERYHDYEFKVRQVINHLKNAENEAAKHDIDQDALDSNDTWTIQDAIVALVDELEAHLKKVYNQDVRI